MLDRHVVVISAEYRLEMLTVCLLVGGPRYDWFTKFDLRTLVDKLVSIDVVLLGVGNTTWLLFSC